MMLLHYMSKKDLKAAIGKPLRYTETSLFGPEYRPDGTIYGARRRLGAGRGRGREWFAQITMKGGMIDKVK